MTKKETKMSEVLVLRLVTGEEILGEVTSTDDDFYIIKNPVMLIVSMPQTVVQGANPQPSVGFMPWMFSMYTNLAKDNKDGIPVPKRHVMFTPTVGAEIENEYKKLFAKVLIPKKSSLILPGV